jgi:hypothetical protein
MPESPWWLMEVRRLFSSFSPLPAGCRSDHSMADGLVGRRQLAAREKMNQMNKAAERRWCKFIFRPFREPKYELTLFPTITRRSWNEEERVRYEDFTFRVAPHFDAFLEMLRADP